MTNIDDELTDLLCRLCAEHDVVGAQLAIDRGGTVQDAVAGVLNADLGTPVTPDALFQIGSITKVWTTTILMQLCEEDLLDLDAPVTAYHPELPSKEPDRMARVTTRDLLAHTSGLEGDVFTDTGRGDDCVAAYVARLGEVGFVHPVGATASYSNAGFVLAGRLVEVLTGQTWDDALRERLIEPLGLDHTQTLPERMMRYAVAHGHAVENGTPTLVPRWEIPRSSGPAGIIAARARDVGAFARMHLRGGLGGDDRRILGAEGVAQMQREQASAPGFGRRGLGWALSEWQPTTFGHNGGTNGQLAFLRVVPELDLVVTLLTNGGDGTALFDALIRAALPEITLPAPLAPPERPMEVDLERFAGTYVRHGATLRLWPEGTQVMAEMTAAGIDDGQGPVTEKLVLHPVAPDRLVTTYHGATWVEACRYEVDGAGYLHFAGRAARRVGPA